MTTDEAFEFFAKFGNVSSFSESLKRSFPTVVQLRAASEYAGRVHNQSLELRIEAQRLVMDHFIEGAKSQTAWSQR